MSTQKQIDKGEAQGGSDQPPVAIESPEKPQVEKRKPEIQIVDLKDAKNQNVDSDSESVEEIATPSNVAYEKPAGFFTFYNMTRLFMDFVMKQFFREIQVLGKHNIPKRGPVIFCGNHQNQMMDGSILFANATRDVRFMVAAKSMRRPVYKTFFEGGKSIPVERP